MENKPPQDDIIKRIIAFQDKEASRFLKEKVNVGVLGDIGVVVSDFVLRSLQGPTKKGILVGLENYLKAKGRERKPLYPISFDDIPSSTKALYDFLIYESMKEPIFDNVVSILSEKDARFYSHYVSEKYRDFAYRESFRVYKEKFKECTLPTSISQSSFFRQNAPQKS